MENKSIILVANAIAAGTSPKDLRESGWKYSEKDGAPEIEEVTTSKEKTRDVLRALFPRGVPISSDFYDTLTRFSRYYGFGDHSEKLIGTLLVAAFDDLSETDQTEMLRLLNESQNLDFWAIIRALPYFLPAAKLPMGSIGNYLAEYAEKVGGDLAGGPFFNAIEQFAYRRPDEAFEVLSGYLRTEIDPKKTHPSSLILGGIRAASRDKRFDPGTVLHLDDELIASPLTQKRLCYHSSWDTSFRLGKVEIRELNEKLQQMLSGVAEEISEAFRVAFACLMVRLEDPIFVSFYIQWVRDHTTPSIPNMAKHWVVNSIWHLCAQKKGSQKLDSRDGADILNQIQPIPSENAGTWRDLEYFLVGALSEGEETFELVLNKVFLADPDTVLKLIADGTLGYLESEMSTRGITKYVFKLLVSENSNLRRLGFGLLQTHKFRMEAGEVLNVVKPEPEILKTLILESIRRPMLGDDTSQFFMALLPVYEQSPPEIQEEFSKEMVLQAINYPGACLAKWKMVENPPGLLSTVIDSAEAYFSKLKLHEHSAANGFAFSGFDRAAEYGRLEQSRKIGKSVKEKSILHQFATTIQIIYGDTWTTYAGGHLGTPSGFSPISHSIEYPRLELIDPEGMAIRRLQAAIELQELGKANGF